MENEPSNTHAAIEPILISIKTAVRISDISRAELYRRMAAGKIKAVKSGSSTKICLTSLRAHINSLPPATFRGAKSVNNG